MKKALFLLTLTIGSLVLAGCGSSDASPQAVAPATGNAAPRATGGPKSMAATE